jgi:predicted alpha/beta superfamily hydrolase
MSITIPVWLLWTLGGIVAIFVLLMAVVGFAFLWMFSGASWWR